MIDVMSLPREQTCTGCGLLVQPGYPQCPRCKMALPKVESPLATATQTSPVQGGTVLDEGKSPPWLWPLGALLLVGIVVAIISLRKNDKSAVTAPAVATKKAIATKAPVNSPIPTGPAIGIATQPGEPSDAEDRRQALSDLNRALNDARLWATVAVDFEDTSVVSVVSSACEQNDMRPVLQSAAEPLSALGFASIHCVAKHGALVFELQL